MQKPRAGTKRLKIFLFDAILSQCLSHIHLSAILCKSAISFHEAKKFPTSCVWTKWLCEELTRLKHSSLVIDWRYSEISSRMENKSLSQWRTSMYVRSLHVPATLASVTAPKRTPLD